MTPPPLPLSTRPKYKRLMKTWFSSTGKMPAVVTKLPTSARTASSRSWTRLSDIGSTNPKYIAVHKPGAGEAIVKWRRIMSPIQLAAVDYLSIGFEQDRSWPAWSRDLICPRLTGITLTRKNLQTTTFQTKVLGFRPSGKVLISSWADLDKASRLLVSTIGELRQAATIVSLGGNGSASRRMEIHSILNMLGIYFAVIKYEAKYEAKRE
ncbi:hypothetical protein EDB82DRAFT_473794 [Fusarium venenatum]|uniref:uncharacterized protein n=1 Tax=Fusarium venenatum TaxID=56646 RepID=UPI001D1E6A5A|nr:hypothetical protein EDB82DRAFT_473794 [Fusarium venenatum]